MSGTESISVNKCHIEFLPGTQSYLGKPVSEKSEPDEQQGTLRTFRVTSSDRLNLICGLVEWPAHPPEIRPIDLIDGLQKHQALKGRGSMSLVNSQDDKWLAPIRALKFSPAKGYFTLQGVAEEDLDLLIGHSFREFLLNLGALRVGTRAEIDGDDARTSNQLAAVIEPGDVRTLAVIYTVTRPLAVIHDLGLELA